MHGRKLINFVNVAAASAPEPPVSPFPLLGAAIDLSFPTGQYFGGTPADCFNAGKTQAAGALLAALIANQGTILLELNPLTPDGTTVWFLADSADRIIWAPSDTVVRCSRSTFNPANGTLGGGTTFSGGTSKVGSSWSSVSNRSAVGNDGVVGTNGVAFNGGATAVAVNLNIDTLCRRLTVWTTKLADADLKAFTA